jgi:hypothetical protein
MAFTGPRVCGVERFRPIIGTIVCPNPRRQTHPFSETSGRVRGGVKKGLGIAFGSKCKKNQVPWFAQPYPQ